MTFWGSKSLFLVTFESLCNKRKKEEKVSLLSLLGHSLGSDKRFLDSGPLAASRFHNLSCPLAPALGKWGRTQKEWIFSSELFGSLKSSKWLWPKFFPLFYFVTQELSGPDGSRHSSDQHPKDVNSENSSYNIIWNLCPWIFVLPKANSRGVEFLCFYSVWIFVPPTEKLPSVPGTDIPIFCLFCLLWP